MSQGVKKNTTWSVMTEVTEGTHVAPGAATDYVQTLIDGSEMTPTKELLSRAVSNGSLGESTPRTGIRSVTGSLVCEARADATAGAAPEYDELMEAGMGSTRSTVTKTSSIADDAGGNAYSDKIIRLADVDAGTYQAGDIVMTKRAGAYHVSPIVSVNDAAGQVEVVLLVADPAGAYVDGIALEASHNYLPSDAAHDSLSVSKWIEGAVLEQADGCKVTSVALENFATGQLPTFNFGFEGLSFDRTVSARPHTPSFDAALPPIVLNARLHQDGAAACVEVTNVGFSLENTLAFATSICSPNGKSSSRITERKITGSFNPPKTDSDVNDFDSFDTNAEYSLFGYAYVPSGVAGEFGQVVAFYMPQCLTTEIGEGDEDGLLTNELTFSATRGPSGILPEIYIAVI